MLNIKITFTILMDNIITEFIDRNEDVEIDLVDDFVKFFGDRGTVIENIIVNETETTINIGLIILYNNNYYHWLIGQPSCKMSNIGYLMRKYKMKDKPEYHECVKSDLISDQMYKYNTFDDYINNKQNITAKEIYKILNLDVTYNENISIQKTLNALTGDKFNVRLYNNVAYQTYDYNDFDKIKNYIVNLYK